MNGSAVPMHLAAAIGLVLFVRLAHVMIGPRQVPREQLVQLLSGKISPDTHRKALLGGLQTKKRQGGESRRKKKRLSLVERGREKRYLLGGGKQKAGVDLIHHHMLHGGEAEASIL